MQQLARQLGRYHVLDRIAFGGMAEIFRAITFDDEGVGRLVAIKQVLPHYAEDREFIDMLVDEARMISMLHHGNIVEIFEFGHFDEFYFVAMEHVWGKDLRAVLERCRAKGTRIPFEVGAHLLSEALGGLDTAHRLLDPQGLPAGLVHRDFSPSNILISYNGDIKICDFGIAKATFTRIETKTGVIKGKVKYMSPEQAFGRKLDHRSDVFSAGSVLYEMLTNEPPFLAKNEIDLIFLVRDAVIVRPTKRVADTPGELEEMVYRSMARARSARYQSAAEFRHALQSYLRRRGVGDWKAELKRFMRSLYSDEMSKEHKVLNDYTLDQTQIGENLGQNLIADALGQDAVYTKFNPYPTRAHVSPDDPALHDASTRIFVAPEVQDVASIMTESPYGPGPVDQQATAILELPDLAPAGPGGLDDAETAHWPGSNSPAPNAGSPPPPAEPEQPQQAAPPVPAPPPVAHPPVAPPPPGAQSQGAGGSPQPPPVPPAASGYKPPPPPMIKGNQPPPAPPAAQQPIPPQFTPGLDDSQASTMPVRTPEASAAAEAGNPATGLGLDDLPTKEKFSNKSPPAPPQDALDNVPTQAVNGPADDDDDEGQPTRVATPDGQPTRVATPGRQPTRSGSPPGGKRGT